LLKHFLSMLEGLNAMSLALGVIIGGAIGKVVASLTGDVLMPFLSLVIPGGSWRTAEFVLRRDAAGAVVNSVKVGSFAGAIVDFLIIAYVIQWLTKMLVKPAPAAPVVPMKTCGECRESVLLAARKCRYCGSAV
jgi:large conductance mechanosensitive channel